jgi:hypothetical protein
MRPKLTRSSWLDIMTGKSLRKIGRDRQGKQRKEVCLHEEEVGSGEDSVGLEAGLEANRICAGEQEVQREGWCRDWKRIGHRLFPFTSMLTEIV